MHLLIANRGEIARRVIRTARKNDIGTVAVYADPDEGAPFVTDADQAIRIGPAALADSYLNIDAILAAAKSSGATAVHPGYGFLSEHTGFAEQVIAAGLIWVGPSADAIRQMGDKIEARRLAVAASVPVIPGYDDSQADQDLQQAAEQIGYPVLIKAAAGGGGKGIRIVREAAEFAAALSEARTEAERNFANADVIVERYIERARHIEVQIIADKHGNVMDLGTRECSVQRRYQKLLEEAPAPNLSDATRDKLCAAARALAASIGYDSAGTVEFVLDAETEEFFFLEMNTRLQVEHPVTEAVTGLDLVALQIAVAQGDALSLKQTDVTFEGHAIEARINAEDATNDFAPQTGRISFLEVPEYVRWDSAVEQGSTITPHYDPMVAKLIVHGKTRQTALATLRQALDELIIGGIVVNGGFHAWLAQQDALTTATVTTKFLESTSYQPNHSLSDAAVEAAGAWLAAPHPTTTGPWGRAYRVVPHQNTLPVWLVHQQGEVIVADPTAADNRETRGAIDIDGRTVVINVEGQSHTFSVLTRSEAWAPAEDADNAEGISVISAPFPAVVTEVNVEPGDEVHTDSVVVVIEAMKMLHSLAARGHATVESVNVSPGDTVEANQVLVRFQVDD